MPTLLCIVLDCIFVHKFINVILCLVCIIQLHFYIHLQVNKDIRPCKNLSFGEIYILV